MIISDLNYLESVEENIQGGYDFGGSSFTRTAQILNVKLGLISKVAVVGNFAGAEAAATALGPDTSTQAITGTLTTSGSSESAATSTSATGPSSFMHWR